ncbi:MAG: NAD(P)H-hydrate epimerase [Planctomycetaceae bacterium]|nr:NAD(P)H-hydrate epimerase [Planctomycetaceae bacterium]
MNEPLTLSVAQVRRIDQFAIDELGVPGIVLMENAGRGAVDALLEFDPALANGEHRVGILCGKGNNAGDGFVVARHLAIRGVPAVLVLLSDPAELRGDAAANLAIARQMDLPRCDVSGVDASDAAAIGAALDEAVGDAAWLVDAMLGTGATGEPRPPFDAAVRWANAQPARRLALDVPTGLDADAGDAAAVTFRADLTCTFAANKRGFLAPAAAEFLGELRVVSIGLPETAIRSAIGE